MRNIFLIIFVSFFLAGCFEFGILVKVNKDGSGTIEQTVLMNKTMIKQMQELSESFGGAKGKPFSLIDKKKLVKDAATMGKGVTYRYVKPISDKKREGYTAYYSFKDINMLKVNQNPSDKTRLPGEVETKSPEEPMTFSFQSGKQPVLTIRQPEKTFSPDSASDNREEQAAAADDTSGLEMMIEMMKGFRVSIALEVTGKILKTNSSYVDNNRVTFMEMDFEQLIRDREKFKAISSSKPQSMEEAKELLKDIPGIKLETAKEITIQFE